MQSAMEIATGVATTAGSLLISCVLSLPICVLLLASEQLSLALGVPAVNAAGLGVYCRLSTRSRIDWRQHMPEQSPAKDGTGVQEVFSMLAKEIVKKNGAAIRSGKATVRKI